MTLPTVSPVLLFAVVIGVIEALQYFTQAYVASQHRRRRRRQTRRTRPTGSATPRARRCSIPLLLYQQGFRFFNMGYASAMAIVLLVGRLRGHR